MSHIKMFWIIVQYIKLNNILFDEKEPQAFYGLSLCFIHSILSCFVL